MKTPVKNLPQGVACFLLLAAMASPAPAWAASCTQTTRAVSVLTTAVGSAMTTVKNGLTGEALQVQIFRTDTEKLNQSVKPGDQVQFKAGLGGTSSDAKITVTVTPGNGEQTEACSYVVGDAPGGTSMMEWKLPKDATSVCPNLTTLTIACAKTWHKDKNQFHTVFTVSEP